MITIMPDKQPCPRCQHYALHSQDGILCDLTESAPLCETICKHFRLDPMKSPVITISSLAKIKKKLRYWGIYLVIVGIANLSVPIIGSIFIILGILSLIRRKQGMLITNGVVVVVIGIGNILGVILLLSGSPIPPLSSANGFVEVFIQAFIVIVIAFSQLFLGIHEILVYRKDKFASWSHKISAKRLSSLKSIFIESSELTQIHGFVRQHSRLGIASLGAFLISCIIVLLLINFQALISAQELAIFLWFMKKFSTWKWFIKNVIIPITDYWRFIIIITPSIVGFGLGFKGLIQKKEKRIFAIIGVVLNLIYCLYWLLI